MRYYPVEQLKEGMVLGQEIQDARGNMLLEKSTILTKEKIAYIIRQEVGGLYIDDEISKDIQIHDVVQPEIKQAALSLISDIFGKTVEASQADVDGVRENVRQVVDNVIENQDVAYNMLEIRTYDNFTYFHSVGVGILSGVIGAKCGLSTEEMENLVMAGFLHDIGKVFIDPSIITAPRSLTQSERFRMMDHPQEGYNFLSSNYDMPEDVLRAVLEHHEWYDGSGYPGGKTFQETLFISRIIKAADVYDAMTSKRSYHDPYLPSDVLEYIMGRSGMEFDPNIVRTMVQELCVYPVGCEVVLSNGQKALVVENHKGYSLRPVVKMLSTGELLDLTGDRDSWNVTIVKLMV